MWRNLLSRQETKRFRLNFHFKFACSANANNMFLNVCKQFIDSIRVQLSVANCHGIENVIDPSAAHSMSKLSL